MRRCVAGYGGTLCADCASGFSRQAGFDLACAPGACVSPALRILLACLAGLFAVAVLIRILYTISGSKEGSKTRVGVTLAKIALSLIQVLTLLEFVLALRWPIG